MIGLFIIIIAHLRNGMKNAMLAAQSQNTFLFPRLSHIIWTYRGRY